jgi:4-alpha-glucanotransferase
VDSARGVCRVRFRDPIPLGVHQLIIEHGRETWRRFVLARPRSLGHTTTHAGRRLAVFLPLYSVAPGGPFGVGSYSDLRDLCVWADRAAGSLVGTLPLFPAFLDRPFDPSPYAPISRLMWNELFIDPRETPEWSSPDVQRGATSVLSSRAAVSIRTGPLVDYRGAWNIARRVLSKMAAVARASPSRWAEVVSQASAETMRYALFRAAVDATGTCWDAWPAAWRLGRIDPALVDPSTVQMYLYAQTVASSQIRAIGSSTHAHNPLYLDLPVGVHAGGFDTYTRPDLFLHGISAGAPPDPLNTQGQMWGFPPLHPTAGRADGYAHLRAVLRRMLSVTGVLRIDHVMGLYRMFCVPEGHDGTHGAYVRYPEDEMFAIVMIEAARVGATVVGEDLGTVPPPVRSIMKRAGILGMHVQQFAVGAGPGPSIEPAGSHVLASLNTHDTPTFAGFWKADDATLRLTLGQTDEAGAATERAGRTRTRRAVAAELGKLKLPAGTARDAAMSIMRLQARGPAPITLVNLEDLWGERRPQNVPGTSTEYPNWRRRTAGSFRSILSDAGIAGALSALRRERRRRPAKGRP